MPIALIAADPSATGRLQEFFSLWTLWLPLVLGAVSIYILLPRPRPLPMAGGIVAGLAALVLAALLILQSPTVLPEAALFYVFSALSILGGVLLVTQHNPARAALSFTLVVLSTCGLFLLLAAPFLMAATIIIYAGAIIVTFLFVLMLASQVGMTDADNRSREPMLATGTGFVLLFAILYVLRAGYDARQLDGLLATIEQARYKENFGEVQRLVQPRNERGEPTGADLFLRSKDFVAGPGGKDLWESIDRIEKEWNDAIRAQNATAGKNALEALADAVKLGSVRLGTFAQPPEAAPLSSLSGPAANTPAGEIRRNPVTHLPEVAADNSAYLGRSLFTDYLVPVEIGGLLLLVATVGAIAIGQRRTDEAAEAPGVGRSLSGRN